MAAEVQEAAVAVQVQARRNQLVVRRIRRQLPGRAILVRALGVLVISLLARYYSRSGRSQLLARIGRGLPRRGVLQRALVILAISRLVNHYSRSGRN